MLSEGPKWGGLPTGAGLGFPEPASECGSQSTTILPLTGTFRELPSVLLDLGAHHSDLCRSRAGNAVSHVPCDRGGTGRLQRWRHWLGTWTLGGGEGRSKLLGPKASASPLEATRHCPSEDSGLNALTPVMLPPKCRTAWLMDHRKQTPASILACVGAAVLVPCLPICSHIHWSRSEHRD